MRSAAGLNVVTVPLSSIVMMPSITWLTTERIRSSASGELAGNFVIRSPLRNAGPTLQIVCKYLHEYVPRARLAPFSRDGKYIHVPPPRAIDKAAAKGHTGVSAARASGATDLDQKRAGGLPDARTTARDVVCNLHV